MLSGRRFGWRDIWDVRGITHLRRAAVRLRAGRKGSRASGGEQGGVGRDSTGCGGGVDGESSGGGVKRSGGGSGNGVVSGVEDVVDECLETR